jgi:hypothetical protein
MRDTTLGRWMTRLAVTLGAGAVLFGLSSTVAYASVSNSEASAVRLVGVGYAVQATTESWDWG